MTARQTRNHRSGYENRHDAGPHRRPPALTLLAQIGAELARELERIALELRRQHSRTTDQAADARPADALRQLQAAHGLRYPLIRVTEVAERQVGRAREVRESNNRA